MDNSSPINVWGHQQYIVTQFPYKDKSNQISVEIIQGNQQGFKQLNQLMQLQKYQMQNTRTINVKFTTLMTYSEITVAIAAPPIPKWKKNIKIGSSIAFSKLPAPDNTE